MSKNAVERINLLMNNCSHFMFKNPSLRSFQ